jgi:hypothetical protein
MELWRLWEFGAACATLALNLFCAIIYAWLYLQRPKALGFALLAATCGLLVFMDMFSIILQTYGAFGFWLFGKPTVRVLHKVYMCVGTLAYIPGFLAPIFVSRYVLRETKT